MKEDILISAPAQDTSIILVYLDLTAVGRSGNVYKLAHEMINSTVVSDTNFITWLDAEEIYGDKLSNWLK